MANGIPCRKCGYQEADHTGICDLEGISEEQLKEIHPKLVRCKRYDQAPSTWAYVFRSDKNDNRVVILFRPVGRPKRNRWRKMVPKSRIDEKLAQLYEIKSWKIRN